MEQFVLDFFERIGTVDFEFVMNLLLYALGIFWIVVLYWVWLDSGDRTSKIIVRIAYVLLVTILNIVGLFIYLMIRPSQTIEEIYWSDLERRYLKYETSELGDCPKCGEQLFPGYRFCPKCKYRLKIKCSNCGVYIDRQCKFCPSCGNETRENSSFVPAESPSKEVMQEQILASKEKAVEVVESNQVRYSYKKGIAEKLGNSILALYSSTSSGIKKIVQRNKKDKSKKNIEKANFMTSSNRKKSKKKGKKKK